MLYFGCIELLEFVEGDVYWLDVDLEVWEIPLVTVTLAMGSSTTISLIEKL